MTRTNALQTVIGSVGETSRDRVGRGTPEKEGPNGKVAVEQERNSNFAPSQARGCHFTRGVSWMIVTHPFSALVLTEAQTGPER